MTTEQLRAILVAIMFTSTIYGITEAVTKADKILEACGIPAHSNKGDE